MDCRPLGKGWLALFLVLAAGTHLAAAGELRIKSILSYGLYGPQRPGVAQAGEQLYIHTSVENLQKTLDGQIRISGKVLLRDMQGDVVIQFRINEQGGKPVLGGQGGHIVNLLHLPRDLPGGVYTLEIEVRDLVANHQIVDAGAITVAPATEFGALNLRYAHDKAGQQPASGNATLGQVVYVLFSLVNSRAVEGKVNVRLNCAVLDEEGQETGSALEMNVDVMPNGEPINLEYHFPCLRAGRFQQRIRVEDRHAGVTKEYRVPLVIHKLVELPTEPAEAK